MTKAPSELRFLICALLTGTGDPESLANVNTTLYPDGAQCYVVSEGAAFVLVKTSTAAAVSGQVLIPGSGPGRWFKMTVADALAPPALLQSSGNNTFAADANFGTSSTSNFGTGFDLTLPSQWTLTALGGILTYSGENRRFLCTATATVQVGDATAARQVFVVIAKNNDVTGAGSAGGPAGSQGQTIATAAVPFGISCERQVDLVATDTIRLKMSAPAAATSLTATAITLSIAPL